MIFFRPILLLSLCFGFGLPVWAQVRETTWVHAASSAGDTDRLRQNLDPNSPIDQWDERGLTALAHASAKGHRDVVRLLIEHGADSNKASDSGIMPLGYAAAYGQDEVIEILLEAGARVDGAAEHGHTALTLAAGYGRTDVVLLLLDSGADIERRGPVGRTAVFETALDGNIDMLGVLHQAGARLDVRDRKSHTPLMVSQMAGHPQFALACLRLMIDDGIDTNLSDPLTMAVLGNDHELAMALLDCGARPTVGWAPGHITPLGWACKYGDDVLAQRLTQFDSQIDSMSPLALEDTAEAGHHLCVAILVEQGVRLSQEKVTTIIREGLKKGDIEVAAILLRARREWANLEHHPIHDTEDQLIQAVWRGDEDEVRRIADQGLRVTPDARSIASAAALHRGDIAMRELILSQVRTGRPENRQAQMPRLPSNMIARLIHNGELQAARERLARTEGQGHSIYKTWDHMSALAFAANLGDVELMQLLLDNGALANADPAIGDVPPLREAVTGEHPQAVALLLRAGADPDTIYGSMSVLHLAASFARHEIVALLLDAGANPDLSTEFTVPPLHAAVQAGSVESVRHLVEAGADPSALGKYDANALGYAVGFARPECEQIIREAAGPALETGALAPAIGLVGDDIEEVRRMLDAGVDPNLQVQFGDYWFTPLQQMLSGIANSPKQEEVAMLLIERGAEITYPSVNAYALLPTNKFNLDRPANLRMLSVLGERGYDMNIENPLAKGPMLWYAVDLEAIETARLLLKYGADPTGRDEMGESIRDAARRTGHDEMIQLIEDAIESYVPPGTEL